MECRHIQFQVVLFLLVFLGRKKLSDRLHGGAVFAPAITGTTPHYQLSVLLSTSENARFSIVAFKNLPIQVASLFS